MSDIKSRRIRRWILAGAWTGLIYSTLYIVRPICEFLKQYAGFSFFVNAGIVFFGISIVLVFVKTKRIRRRLTYALLFLVIAVYSLGMTWLSIPEERLHFVEYGVLAFLIYRALILDLRAGQSFLAAFAITSLIGLGDEGIQYLLPNRYYQFKDVCLNSASAALGLALTYVIGRDQATGTGG
ncbi:MAG: VanZ family protein [Candidatus Omnitrophica bacterium]|nr:VanZ family protein [Candidatus Omnitrophota bacterium]